MADDVKEAKPLSVTIRTADDQLHSGYLIGTPRPPRRAFHQMLALLAITRLILAGVGLVVSIITTAAWAGVTLIVGLGVFCVAGYLAEPTAQGG
jgi:hypothetical protein